MIKSNLLQSNLCRILINENKKLYSILLKNLVIKSNIKFENEALFKKFSSKFPKYHNPLFNHINKFLTLSKRPSLIPNNIISISRNFSTLNGDSSSNVIDSNSKKDRDLSRMYNFIFI